jgi:hypothetical protein
LHQTSVIATSLALREHFAKHHPLASFTAGDATRYQRIPNPHQLIRPEEFGALKMRRITNAVRYIGT